ncbi:MAG: LysM peptidoglycan-binding domain-containing protein [Bacteroidota bacterium]
MKYTIHLFLFLLVVGNLHAQGPRVPEKMEFAGIKLKLNAKARAEIQKDVDALTRSPKYFNIKVDKANTYFPIIERVFKEENLPNDFKYLVLQESALIPDAVSTSNAVGYWQFKYVTGREMGLRIDSKIDERMHIISASRAAAKYLKKNNFFFDNWLHALQAYQMGAGGAQRALKGKDNGAKSMNITGATYWYVKKYLAHKVAFENAVGRTNPPILLHEFKDSGNKTLKEIAREVNVEEEELVAYNKWLRKGRIPADKNYPVIVPLADASANQLLALESVPKGKTQTVSDEIDLEKSSLYPIVKTGSRSRSFLVRVNGLPGIVAEDGDKVTSLSQKSGVDLRKFLKYNDINVSRKISAGDIFYLKSKKSKAKERYHVVRKGETLWSISQKYGIKLKKLRLKNRITNNVPLKEGRVLWLRYIRPADVPVAYQDVPEVKKEQPVLVEKEEKETFTEDIVQTKTKESDGKIEEVKKEPENDQEGEEETVEDVKKEQDIVAPVKPVDEAEETAIEEEQVAEDKGQPDDEEETQKNELPVINNPEATTKEKTAKVHKVQSGDTFYGLSKKYGIHIQDLLDWNGLDINDKLAIGQELIIGQGQSNSDDAEANQSAEKTDEFLIHEVVSGDTLYGIARKYGVTVKDIMSWNDKKEFDLGAGEKLKIKKVEKDTQ